MNASNFDSNIERDRIYIDSSFFFERKLGYFVNSKVSFFFLDKDYFF